MIVIVLFVMYYEIAIVLNSHKNKEEMPIKLQEILKPTLILQTFSYKVPPIGNIITYIFLKVNTFIVFFIIYFKKVNLNLQRYL